jgi:hypothetical protein
MNVSLAKNGFTAIDRSKRSFILSLETLFLSLIKKIENLNLYMCYYIFTSLSTLVATQVVADGVF